MRTKVSRKDQLSSKIQRKHYELFYAIANSTGWKNAEIMERAIEALAEKQRRKPRYKLKDLLEEYDLSLPVSREEKQWLNAPAIGREEL